MNKHKLIQDINYLEERLRELNIITLEDKTVVEKELLKSERCAALNYLTILKMKKSLYFNFALKEPDVYE